MKVNDRHLRKIERIKHTLLNWKGGERTVTPSHISNTMRKKAYKKHTPPLDLAQLNSIISIDPVKRVAYVEPGVTMEQLIEATLQYDLIPPVVPEFRTITVGGAINGAALESSSHLFGQFNDSCLSYEILLGDGEIIKVSKNEHADLFYGIAGSYGTLGYLVGIELTLVPATGYVEVTYSTYESIKGVVEAIDRLHRSHDPPTMIEAIIYHAKKAVLIEARNAQPSTNVDKQNRYYDQWFYSHADSNPPKKEIFSIKDYLFRHDRGAFWMAGYALHPTLLLRYGFHKLCLLFGIDSEANWMKPPYTYPKNPGILFRTLFGWIVNSQKLYKSLHGGSEKWFEKRFVIQDFYLPLSKVDLFVTYVLQRYKIRPIWLCPIKKTSSPQLFAPHYSNKDELLVDIGVYGLPFNALGPETVKDLEKLTYDLAGRKMFYCHTYLTKEEFWQIYPKDEYTRLRAKANMHENLPDITEKVLS